MRWLGTEGLNGDTFGTPPGGTASFKAKITQKEPRAIDLTLHMAIPKRVEAPGLLTIDVAGRQIVVNYELPVTPDPKPFQFFIPAWAFEHIAGPEKAITVTFTNVPSVKIPAILVADSAGVPAPLGKSATALIAKLPSQMPLEDYEAILYNWLNDHKYTELGWAYDKAVRDTGPFANQVYYGTHPAVKIYYSPEAMTWLINGRKGEIADGAVIVKAMLLPPADIYEVIRAFPYFQQHPADYDELLKKLTSGWSVFIKDRGGKSTDGWFYSGPGAFGQSYKSKDDWLKANLDTPAFNHPFYSGFGMGTCVRCHASAERENTFITLRNIQGYEVSQAPLAFRSDSSWRTPDYLNRDSNTPVYDIVESFLKAKDPDKYRELLDQMNIAATLRPWRDPLKPLKEMAPGDPRIAKLLKEREQQTRKFLGEHARPAAAPMAAPPPSIPGNPAFLNAYRYPALQLDSVVKFPSQWADHVFPGKDGPGPSTNSAHQFSTSSNCMGCHGGLAGSSPSGSGYQVNMFVKTGPNYGDGYNISEFGEWRWSPMGLAGRDPIFHSQLESELIILLKNANQLKYSGWQQDTKNPLQGSVADNQKAVIDTCMSCHGAMGQRQQSIDAAAGRKLPSGSPVNPHFDPNFFYFYCMSS
ncbi:MAG TPA: hypothetical protein VHR66_26595 [Gemmataceae bacterium]|jgi:mono/diheme cytochrome c family protein|nr:hypothetical protein [Gemmataceae bacterium]